MKYRLGEGGKQTKCHLITCIHSHEERNGVVRTTTMGMMVTVSVSATEKEYKLINIDFR